jgi:hypothetical protein
MLTCSECQALLLDRQYALLDPGEDAAVADHVAGCPVCQAEQLKVERFHRLLSAAARSAFPDVRFVAPAVGDVTPAAHAPAARDGTPRTPRFLGRWTGWFVAAGVLVAAAGVPLSAHLATARQQQHELTSAQERAKELEGSYRKLVTERQETLAEAGQAVQRAAELAQTRQADLSRKFRDAEAELLAKQLNVIITGPAAYQAGATNEYRIETLDGRNQPAPATLSYQVKDQKEEVVYEGKAVTSNGTLNLKLPPNLPLTSGRDLALDVVAQADTGRRAELRERLHLASPVYVTHLDTDKPLYQPGETVFYRSLTLDRFSLKPAAEPLHLRYFLRNPLGTETPVAEGSSLVTQADGQLVKLGDGQPVRGVGAGEWVVLPDAPGGEYTLLVREANGRFPEERRKFLVNQYQAARLNKELEWSRKSYGPGDVVVANCKVTRAEGGPVANQPVAAEAFVDGQRVPVEPPAHTDAHGTVAVKLTLPKPIERGEASLSVQFFDGGSQETLTKPIPVALNKLLIDFYPEGGDLVAGAPNRVYFQVRTTLGKSADLQGRVVDGTGQVVARAETLTDDREPGINQGMGRCEFTPEFRQTYKLLIDRPAGIEGEHKLPEVKAEGVVLNTGGGVTGDPDPLRVRLYSPGVARTLLVGAYARGRLLDHRRVSLAANGSADVDLKPEAGVGGVTRVTVFEELPGPGPHPPLRPLAERLVYRRPAAALKLAAKPDKDRYVPGDKVDLKLSAVNEKNEPVPAVAMLGVVNQSVVTMADEKTYRSLPTHFLLTSEVERPEELEHADVLLGDHPKAGAALDLLLGTQGWRRFAEQKANERRDKRANDDTRLFFAIGHDPALQTDAFAMERRKVVDALQPGVDEAQRRYEDATKALAALQTDTHFPQEQQRLAVEVQAARDAVQKAQAAVAETESSRRRLLGWLLPTLCALFLAVTLIALVVGLWRGLRYYVTAAGSLVLAAAAAVLLALHVGGGGDGRQLTRHGPGQEPQVVAEAATTLDAAKLHLGLDLPAPKGNIQFGGFPAPDGKSILRLDEPKDAPADALGTPLNRAVPGGMPAPAAPMPAREVRGEGKPMDGTVPAPQAPAPMAPPTPPGPANKPASRAAGAPNSPVAPGRGGKFERPGEPSADPNARPVPALGRLGGDDRKGDGAARPVEMKKEVERRAGVQAAGEKARGEPELQGRRHLEAAKDLQQQKQQDKEALADLYQRQAGAGGGRGLGLPAGTPPAGAGFGGSRNGAPAGGLMPGQVGGPFGGPGGPGFAKLRSMPPPAPFVVREYAHRHTLSKSEDRSDFAETVYWHPVLVLPKDGAHVSFDLSDAVTRYRVLAAAHTTDGRLGALTTQIEARKPITLEPKLPVEITAGDKIDVPLTIANDTNAARAVNVEAKPQGLTLSRGSLESRLTLAPEQRTRWVFRFQPTIPEGTAELRFSGRCDPLPGDSVVATLPVVPEGFPVVGTVSDVLERVARHDVVLPDTWVKGTLKCQVSVFPSTLAELQKGLEGLLREPGGCFEQTSTTNYPNTLILEYLKESDQANPDAVRRARGLLERGYTKLTAFEVSEGGKREGFEWFGQAPAHEALTAYGLMQFRDMARVSDVDPALLKRTRDLLMARRDGKGGFKRNPQALDTFGRAPEDVTNAYIVWALTESGKDDDVTRELNALAGLAKDSHDPYFLALVANSLLNRGRTDDALAILRNLAGALTKDGYLDGAKISITGSTGRMLHIETTALAVLGWLKANRPEFSNATRAAVGWIGKQRGGYGGFGSTQSTILALKALIAYTKANKQAPEAGELGLFVGNRPVNKLSFAAGTQDALTVTVPDADRLMQPGKNDLRVEITGKNTYPYTLTWSYQTLQPPSAEGCAVRLTTALDRPELAEGETTHLKVRLENVSGKGQGMTVAVIGLPAGLKLPDDFKQLRDLARLRDNGKKPGVIGAFEVRGRELVLYWRDLAPDAKVELNLDLRGHVPGEYRGPASRAYLYYNPDAKFWTSPLAAVVLAK